MSRPEKQSFRFAGISYTAGLVARVIRVGEVPGSNPGAPTQRTPANAGVFCLANPDRIGQRMGSKAGSEELDGPCWKAEMGSLQGFSQPEASPVASVRST
jgi:hypothetical protein